MSTGYQLLACGMRKCVDEVEFCEHLEELGEDVATSAIEGAGTLIGVAGRHAGIESFLEQASLSAETDEVDDSKGRVLVT